MKKFYSFLGAAAILSLASCSNDNFDGPNNPVTGEFETNFLSINIVPTPDNGTRAGGDKTEGNNNPDSDSQYEEGYENENKVTKVRFYFFDDQGNTAAVKSNGYNYFDWDATDATTSDMPNVEKQLQAVVIIETPKGDKLPTQVVAVLNYDLENLGTDNLTLSNLRDRARNYVNDERFVMMNSVYKYGTEEIKMTHVTPENYATTQDIAKTKPVNIYVERGVAKVRVHFEDGLANNGKIALTDNKKVPIKIGERQVYLKVGKWDLTAESNMGYLGKHINAGWADNLFGNRQWNYSPYFRSYWAINPTKGTDGTTLFSQSWHSFNDISTDYYSGTGNDNVKYTNENAPENLIDKNVEKFTKVILSGQLVDENNQPLEIIKYAGDTYVGNSKDDFKDFKNALLNFLKGKIYLYTPTGDKTSVKEIEIDDVIFKTALDSKIDGVTKSETTTGRYNVYLQLSEGGESKSWTTSNGDDFKDEANTLTSDKVNELLVNLLGRAQIYNSGNTYYYFPIQHLGDKGNTGEYGVVRNHIYDCVITAVYGLGTPVYDPYETIYPEKPEDDETYIAARINILSWRLVNNKIELDWTNP